MSVPGEGLAGLRDRLDDVMIVDQRRLRRRLDGAAKAKDPQARQRIADEISVDLGTAAQRLEARRAALPTTIHYPDELPISQRRDEIMAAIRDHQVVIVAGETGSGKTTQLPKMCLELGRGVRGLIGHTQPRRLAARTVADRIAEELGTHLGETVGYQVRFNATVGDSTLVKLMTDGILLAELAQDRALAKYDTLIIDEAHERSLNIDFILGYLKQLLPRRPDLKLIITSATIETARFAEHFGTPGRPAPVIEVSGRTYPVELRYRPLEAAAADDEEDEPRDQTAAICDAVDELGREGNGDILVFLSGEREIKDTADALNRRKLLHTEVIPLYARLSTADQHRVFAPHTGRRIVLATNVAETSLTVPGIKYVIDPGTARISRYSHRLKVQRLPIEPVSQASANQRAGRCGRTSDGICIRLYSEPDFQARPEFTEPEILRTNLASVILQMAALNLVAEPGEVARFGFIDPPDRRQVTDGVALLQELGALDGGKLTASGRRLAQLPVDPRLGRMVLEAERNGCVREVLVIAAALSIQDPRERPAEWQQQAAQQHARFKAESSDFVAYLNLWNYLQDKQKELSSNQFRKLCKAEFLHYLRVREWQDLFIQLRQATRGLGVPLSSAPEATDRIHQSLLAGLLSHVGMYEQEKREYAGARNARFAIFPGSALFRKGPRWVMAAELVETSRLWARVVAKIEPEWIEPLATHLVKRSYSEPHWEKSQGSVMAYEKVTLYGVPIVARRRITYGRIDPVLSRELFIRHALVEGDWQTRHEFFHDNRALLEEVEELEHRVRRRDILVDDETLFAFYDQRLPADVVSGRHFDAWWKKARRTTPELLSFEKSMLIAAGAGGPSAADFPDAWTQGDLTLPLTYQFEPGAAADGVTVHVPLPLLNQVVDDFDWQVPGLREELIIALIRSLPKALRRNFVPVPDFAADIMESLRTQAPGAVPLLGALEAELRRLTGVLISRSDWDLAKVPEHLKMTIRVEGDAGAAVAAGKNLEVLREALQPKVRETLAETFAEVSAEVPHAMERQGLRAWSIDALPASLTRRRAGYDVTAYPALVDEGDSVAVRLLETPDEQQRAMRAGTRRLLLLTVPSPAKFVALRLNNAAKLVLTRNPHGGVAALIDDCAGAAVDEIVDEHGGPAWDEAGFAALVTVVRAELNLATMEIVTEVQRILAAAHELETRLKGINHPTFATAVVDLRDQLKELVHPGFVTETGAHRLRDVVRYLRAALRRLDKVAENPARDTALTEQLDDVRDEYEQLVRELPPGRRGEAAVREIHWMIQELRVSYFAQVLGTAYPISDKRIYRAMNAL